MRWTFAVYTNASPAATMTDAIASQATRNAGLVRVARTTTGAAPAAVQLRVTAMSTVSAPWPCGPRAHGCDRAREDDRPLRRSRERAHNTCARSPHRAR